MSSYITLDLSKFLKTTATFSITAISIFIMLEVDRNHNRDLGPILLEAPDELPVEGAEMRMLYRSPTFHGPVPKKLILSVLRDQLRLSKQICIPLSKDIKEEFKNLEINLNRVDYDSVRYRYATKAVFKNKKIKRQLKKLQNVKFEAYKKNKISETRFNDDVIIYLNDPEVAKLAVKIEDLVTLTLAGKNISNIQPEDRIPNLSVEMLACMAIEEDRMLIDFVFRTFRTYFLKGKEISLKNIKLYNEFKKSSTRKIREKLLERFGFHSLEESLKDYSVILGDSIVGHPHKFYLMEEYKNFQREFLRELLAGRVRAQEFNKYLERAKKLDDEAIELINGIKEIGLRSLDGKKIEPVEIDFEQMELIEEESDSTSEEDPEESEILERENKKKDIGELSEISIEDHQS